MAATDHTETVDPSNDDRQTERADPSTAVAVLDDDTAVELFLTITAPTTVPAVADAQDIPLSTAYRKIHKLERAGLLRIESAGSDAESQTTRYERAVDGVTVTLRDDLRVTYVREDD